MPSVKRVWVYEYLSGGGLAGLDPQAQATLLPLGLSMRNAMVADLLRLDGLSVSVASGVGVPAVPHADKASCTAQTMMPHPGEPPFEFVLRQAALHDVVWVVAPETRGLLAEMASAVPANKWLGCQPSSIALTTDKRATLAKLHEHGVLTPLAFEHSVDTRRWVVKPNDGAGAVDTCVYARKQDALAQQALQRQAGADHALEPWVDGEAMSVSLLCSPGKASLLSANRQHIVVNEAGALSYEGVAVNVLPAQDPRLPALQTLGQRLVQAIEGLRGFVGIDLVWHQERGPVVIEVNPRVTCAYVGLSAALGRNLAADIMAAHSQEWSHDTRVNV